LLPYFLRLLSSLMGFRYFAWCFLRWLFRFFVRCLAISLMPLLMPFFRWLLIRWVSLLAISFSRCCRFSSALIFFFWCPPFRYFSTLLEFSFSWLEFRCRCWCWWLLFSLFSPGWFSRFLRFRLLSFTITFFLRRDAISLQLLRDWPYSFADCYFRHIFFASLFSLMMLMPDAYFH